MTWKYKKPCYFAIWWRLMCAYVTDRQNACFMDILDWLPNQCQWGVAVGVMGECTQKKIWRGCAAWVFDQIPLAKDMLVETYLCLRRISWSWAHFYMILRNFSPNIPFSREIFRKQILIYTPPPPKKKKKKYIYIIYIYPWLRTLEEKYILG